MTNTPNTPQVLSAAVTLSKGTDGVFRADSRDVAARFARRHDNVLQAIRDVARTMVEAGQPIEIIRLNFQSFKINDLTGESTSHYLMDRKGFVLLAMGFTGAEAVKWKLAYIDAFDAMEQKLVALTPAEQLLASVQLTIDLEKRQRATELAVAAVEARVGESLYVLKGNLRPSYMSAGDYLESVGVSRDHSSVGMLSHSARAASGPKSPFPRQAYKDKPDTIKVTYAYHDKVLAKSWDDVCRYMSSGWK